MSFEPEILAFCCNWCSYAGADLAGVSRYQYPPNVRIIRVMCSGRIDPEFILHAFQKGIDGVMVIGCHIGDCHYVSGNLEAEKKVKMVKNLLEIVGFESDRLALEWVSAAEGLKFSRLITDFVKRVRLLGPNSMRKKNKKLS